MMGDMAYFPAYFSYARTLAGLTDEQFGHVMRAAIQYAENGTVPELDALEQMGFAFIKEDIDRANDRYKTVCEKNKRNIQKRWETKKQNEKQTPEQSDTVTDTTVYGRINAIPDHTTVYETYQSKSKRKEKEKAIEKATTTAAGGSRVVGGANEQIVEFVPPTVSDVAEYCTKRGYTHVDAEEFVGFYNDSGWTVGDGDPMKSWKAVLRGWEERAKKNAENQRSDTFAGGNSSFETGDFWEAAVRASYGDDYDLFAGANQGGGG